jgi:hypothetical protein
MLAAVGDPRVIQVGIAAGMGAQSSPGEVRRDGGSPVTSGGSHRTTLAQRPAHARSSRPSRAPVVLGPAGACAHLSAAHTAESPTVSRRDRCGCVTIPAVPLSLPLALSDQSIALAGIVAGVVRTPAG